MMATMYDLLAWADASPEARVRGLAAMVRELDIQLQDTQVALIVAQNPGIDETKVRGIIGEQAVRRGYALRSDDG
jgi:hypothetical protein